MRLWSLVRDRACIDVSGLGGVGGEVNCGVHCVGHGKRSASSGVGEDRETSGAGGDESSHCFGRAAGGFLGGTCGGFAAFCCVIGGDREGSLASRIFGRDPH